MDYCEWITLLLWCLKHLIGESIFLAAVYSHALPHNAVHTQTPHQPQQLQLQQSVLHLPWIQRNLWKRQKNSSYSFIYLVTEVILINTKVTVHSGALAVLGIYSFIIMFSKYKLKCIHLEESEYDTYDNCREVFFTAFYHLTSKTVLIGLGSECTFSVQSFCCYSRKHIIFGLFSGSMSVIVLKMLVVVHFPLLTLADGLQFLL